ncbi:DarT ssDNA thymidine ADP-ribosyltransferase family protein [Couchioplanes caeruleus]|uniref:DarT ssDNA thymidine ADP-ribosyltransferase family protein n=1 Tax=Couchioplanes caeruleus TaxID=56438 RepID=UPI0023DEC6AC|nr:DarT ssDNA thymidine ADP-ribosyltransferase family protein [Couchioplanes caeruleus]
MFHFTHLDNLAGIRRTDGLTCDAVTREGMTATEVGAKDIKESGRQRRIPVPPGGHVGDFVPFYFAR